MTYLIYRQNFFEKTYIETIRVSLKSDLETLGTKSRWNLSVWIQKHNKTARFHLLFYFEMPINWPSEVTCTNRYKFNQIDIIYHSKNSWNRLYMNSIDEWLRNYFICIQEWHSILKILSFEQHQIGLYKVHLKCIFHSCNLNTNHLIYLCIYTYFKNHDLLY